MKKTIFIVIIIAALSATSVFAKRPTKCIYDGTDKYDGRDIPKTDKVCAGCHRPDKKNVHDDLKQLFIGRPTVDTCLECHI